MLCITLTSPYFFCSSCVCSLAIKEMFINFCQTQSPYVLQRRRSSLLPWGGDASALVLLWVSAFTGTMLVISRYSSRLYFTITFSYIPLCVALAVPLHTQALTHEKKEQEWKQHKKCGETISKSTVNFLFGCQCYNIAVWIYVSMGPPAMRHALAVISNGPSGFILICCYFSAHDYSMHFGRTTIAAYLLCIIIYIYINCMLRVLYIQLV